MAVDFLWAGVGFLLGLLAAGLAFEFGIRQVRNPESSKITSAWSLGEVGRLDPPRIVAENIRDLRVPKDARIIVKAGAGAVSGSVLRDAEVRMHPDVRSNFALGDEKALVFSSTLHPKAMAVSTKNAPMVNRLGSEFDRLWEEAEPYVERVHIKDLAGRENVEVEVEGTVATVMDYRTGKMLRVTQGGETVGVLAKGKDLEELKGETIRVRGEYRREEGYHVVDADRIRRVKRSKPRTGDE